MYPAVAGWMASEWSRAIRLFSCFSASEFAVFDNRRTGALSRGRTAASVCGQRDLRLS